MTISESTAIAAAQFMNELDSYGIVDNAVESGRFTPEQLEIINQHNLELAAIYDRQWAQRALEGNNQYGEQPLYYGDILSSRGVLELQTNGLTNIGNTAMYSDKFKALASSYGITLNDFSNRTYEEAMTGTGTPIYSIKEGSIADMQLNHSSTNNNGLIMLAVLGIGAYFLLK